MLKLQTRYPCSHVIHIFLQYKGHCRMPIYNKMNFEFPFPLAFTGPPPLLEKYPWPVWVLKTCRKCGVSVSSLPDHRSVKNTRWTTRRTDYRWISPCFTLFRFISRQREPPTRFVEESWLLDEIKWNLLRLNSIKRFLGLMNFKNIFLINKIR